MPSAPPSAALQGFIDDELLRAPLLVEQVIDAGLDHLRKGLPGMNPAERSGAGDLMQAVMNQRSRMVDAYIGSLRAQVAEPAGTHAAASVAPAAGGLRLSLVDEDEVAVDVEISHTIEAIRSTCEYELRELQTYVSALVGDMDVARDHNPLRAETHARALWASVNVLTLPRALRLNFMRHAGTPLAQVLRKVYAASASRLEGMGIEPAAYRTLILPAGSRRSRRGPETVFSPDLHQMRQTMPVPLEPPRAAPMPLEQALQQANAQLRSLPPDAGLTEHGRLFEQQRVQLVEAASSKVDQQLIELFSRLFDAMLSDRQLTPDVQLMLSRLQASALRVALRDGSTLDNREHAVWRFIDRVAFQGDILPPPGDERRSQVLRFVQGLIEHVVGEPDQDAPLYEWALERLLNHEQLRLQTRAAAAEAQIAALHQQEHQFVSEAPVSSMHGTLDLDLLDTVPAALIDPAATARKPASEAQQWLSQRRPGDWVRMFMQGHWVHAQIVWPGERGELWLFGDAASDTTWAVRRRALLTLHTENLLDSLVPRSLLVDAAKRVMRRAVRG